ncbi:hypothetical protein ACFWB2_33145 [Streptomyces virginiae]|uniref:hypothetical protein n=1 Tax=Streptomyces virginiae TaxID=1961 RepID=UPI00324A0FFC
MRHEPRTDEGRARRRTSPGSALAAPATARPPAMSATSLVNAALPQIRTGAGLSDGGTTWVVNAYGPARPSQGTC